jgi:hypothetical protein
MMVGNTSHAPLGLASARVGYKQSPGALWQTGLTTESWYEGQWEGGWW